MKKFFLTSAVLFMAGCSKNNTDQIKTSSDTESTDNKEAITAPHKQTTDSDSTSINSNASEDMATDRARSDSAR